MELGNLPKQNAPQKPLMSTHNEEDIRFAYWVPNVSGGLVVSKIEQRTSWDIDYNRKLAQIAERSGFDYALSQIRFTAGYGAEFQHEPVIFSQALLAATERLKLIVALLPGPWNPALAAKQLAKRRKKLAWIQAEKTTRTRNSGTPPRPRSRPLPTS